MHRTDYGIVSQTELTEPAPPATVSHDGLTARLGCAETHVDAYRLEGASITLPGHYEQLCLPIGAEGTITADQTLAVAPPEIALVPQRRECTLASATPTTWLVISAVGAVEPDGDPVIVDPTACEFQTPETSNILTARLTGELGCTGMKVNARRLEPGDAVPYHTEGRQEEVFVPRTGPGTMRLAETVHQVSRGSVSRVAPETPRSAVNDGDTDVVWVMIGAPPTGAVDDWDPGATILV